MQDILLKTSKTPLCHYNSSGLIVVCVWSCFSHRNIWLFLYLLFGLINFICAGHHSIFNFTILFVLNEDYFQTFVGPQISSTSYNQIVEKQPERWNLNWLEIKVILYHYIQGNENNNGPDFPDTMQVRRQWIWAIFLQCSNKIVILEFHLQKNNPSKLKSFPGTRDGYANRDFLLKIIYFCLF